MDKPPKPKSPEEIEHENLVSQILGLEVLLLGITEKDEDRLDALVNEMEKIKAQIAGKELTLPEGVKQMKAIFERMRDIGKNAGLKDEDMTLEKLEKALEKHIKGHAERFLKIKEELENLNFEDFGEEKDTDDDDEGGGTPPETVH